MPCEGCNRAPAAPEDTAATAAISDVLSRGISIGKTAAAQVKQFDEKHQLSATAVATASSIDEKLGISEKFSAGTSAINQQLRAVDEKYQVSEKTKSALAVAEDKANVASSAIAKSVLTGASWVTGALSKVAKAADEAVQKAKERANGENVADIGGVPHGGSNASVNTAQPAAHSLNLAATPRLYVYNPRGSLVKVVGAERASSCRLCRMQGVTVTPYKTKRCAWQRICRFFQCR